MVYCTSSSVPKNSDTDRVKDTSSDYVENVFLARTVMKGRCNCQGQREWDFPALFNKKPGQHGKYDSTLLNTAARVESLSWTCKTLFSEQNCVRIFRVYQNTFEIQCSQCNAVAKKIYFPNYHFIALQNVL